MTMFMPHEGNMLVIALPGERLRSTVEKVIDDNTVVVHLAYMPMAKSHTYRMGQRVRCRRGSDGFQEIWEALSVEPPELWLVPSDLPKPEPKKPEPRVKAGKRR